MKALAYGLLTLLLAVGIVVISAAQSPVYKVDANGKVVKTEKTVSTAAKKQDSVFQIVDGIKFYRGAKGGLYYYKVSKKTGKPYKVYVTKVSTK